MGVSIDKIGRPPGMGVVGGDLSLWERNIRD